MHIDNSNFDKFIYSGLKGGVLIDSESEFVGYFDAVVGFIIKFHFYSDWL